jgi:hypothetical protein
MTISKGWKSFLIAGSRYYIQVMYRYLKNSFYILLFLVLVNELPQQY